MSMEAVWTIIDMIVLVLAMYVLASMCDLINEGRRMKMTNAEAIETIKANYPPENYSLLREALDKAIQALEGKKRASRAMLPCRCGCKRRERWHVFDTNDGAREMLRCKRCGFEVREKTQMDAIRKWNEEMKSHV